MSISDPHLKLFAERFGRNLKRLRKQLGLSQEKVAFRASLHPTEVGRLERGEQIAKGETVIKLAGALEATPSDLFEGLSWTSGGVAKGHAVVEDDEDLDND